MTAQRSLAGSIRRRHGFVRLLWLCTIAANLCVIGMVVAVVERNRDREIEQAVVLATNYSQIIEQDLAGFISKIDITLLTVRDEVVRQMEHGGIDEKTMDGFLMRQDLHIPEALGVRVVDAAGVIRFAASGIAMRNASIGDRPYFIHLRDDETAGLVFSKPIMGRAAQKWIITLSRRLNYPDGSFAGDVHVAVAVDHFIEMFSRINLGAKGNISLWDKDTVIARYSRLDSSGASTGTATPSDELRELLAEGPEQAIYRTRSGIDGVYRTFCFRRIGNYPLYLVLGLAEDDYLAEWRSDAQSVAWLVVIFVLASLLSSLQIYRSWRRREADHVALLRQEAEYTARLEHAKREAEVARQHSELILTSAGEGICGVDAQGKVIFVNPAARKMLGWAEDEGIGLDLHAHTHRGQAGDENDPDAVCAVRQTLADGERREIKDDLFWRTDGTAFPVEFTVSAMWQDGRINGAVTVFRDIAERKKLEEHITHMALFDELTGLPNRAFLADALPRTSALAVRRQVEVGILYIDLDGFKAVNDHYGHAAGDRLLQEIAARLTACVRAEDVVARMGGDEFLILTLIDPATIPDNCIGLARRIIETVSQPVELPEGEALVGASIGIAIFPLGGENIELSIRQADSAMYRAKRAGKGCYALADQRDV